MHTTQHPDRSWWIADTGNPEYPEYGPYETRREAESDRIGLERTERFNRRLEKARM